MIISLINATKDYGVKPLFNNLNLYINRGDKLGLIGPNGSGKSTLLKVIAGKEPLISGERKCLSSLRVSLVGQQFDFKNNKTVIEEVLEGCSEKRDLLLKYTYLSSEIAKNPNEKKLLEKFGKISELMDSTNSWILERQCKEVLQRLGIRDLHKNVNDLSGGYQKRVKLASSLVMNPDILLLDEPTNHLDASAVEWLQKWLMNFKGTIILITHDRYFLDRITTKLIEISNGETYKYNGNYGDFLVDKVHREESELSSSKKFKGLLKKELEWLKKGPKARGTKQKARLHRIKKMQSSSIVKVKTNLEIDSIGRRIGKKVINAEDIGFSLKTSGKNINLFENFTYDFSSDDRIGIIGPNGCGKSTILDIFSGRIIPHFGKIEFGETIHIGYLDQHTDDLIKGKGLDRKVIDYVEESATTVNHKGKQITASQLLEKFLFPPSHQHSKLSKLSGGEKRRISLCKILISSPNVLILDEPTNDLDIETLNILEDFLDDFNGCVIVVSHDRYFLDRVIDRIFNFENGKLKRYEGNYSKFLDQKVEDDRMRDIERSEKSVSQFVLKKNQFKEKENTKNERKISYKDSLELKKINETLPELENKKNILENDIYSKKGNITEISVKLAKIIETIKNLEERWLELSDLSD